MKTENMTDTPIYLALNMSKVLNSEESFNLMHNVGPRVCITTAAHPGFVGFQANIQTGILPFAGRYGGGKVHMEKELNPIRNYQYTCERDGKTTMNFKFSSLTGSLSFAGAALAW